MNPERWQRVKEVFEVASQHTVNERSGRLRELCGNDTELRQEVEALFRSAEQAPGFLERPALQSFAAPIEAERAESLVGERVGQWRLTELIASGGMGSVYRAERADGEFEQSAAIKLIKPGLVDARLLQRFQHERQMLAQMSHPNIARLLDGGVTDRGFPFLVMEYVEGPPIDEFCDERGLSTAQRLELFRKVCEAVQYAHQRLVVHLDIKPSNILVTSDGLPKLLDFGISRVLDPGAVQPRDSTLTGARHLTPEYASPEQIRGDAVTISSDTYSLGVVLYELMSGHRPYRFPSRSLYDMERVVCEQDPEKPSTAVRRTEEILRQDGTTGSTRSPRLISAQRATQPAKLRRLLSGDLDNIVLMALRKDPEKRYASVEQLSEDVRRHQLGLPVLARPDTVAYRAMKFARRNRAAVAAALTVVLALLGVVVTVLFQQGVVEQERDHALLAQAKAERINEFLQGMLASADPANEGPNVTVRQVLDKAAERVGIDLTAEPEVEATVRVTLARTYLSLAAYDQAIEQLETALSIRRRILGDRHAEVANVLGDLGRVMYMTRNLGQAEVFCREALEVSRLVHGATHADVATALNNLAAVLRAKGDLDAAEELHREALEMRRSLFGSEHEAIAESLNNLAALSFARGQFDRGLPMARAALGIRRRLLGDEHPLAIQSLSNLGSVLVATGRHAEAEPILQEALALYRRRVGDDHPDVAWVLSNLGKLYLSTGQYAQAEAALQECLAIRREKLDEDDPRTLPILQRLADALVGLERFEEAESFLLEAAGRAKRTLGRNDPKTRQALESIVRLYESWGRPDAAATYREKLLKTETQPESPVP